MKHLQRSSRAIIERTRSSTLPRTTASLMSDLAAMSWSISLQSFATFRTGSAMAWRSVSSDKDEGGKLRGGGGKSTKLT